MEIFMLNTVKSTPDSPQDKIIKIKEFTAPQGHKKCDSSFFILRKRHKTTVLVVFWGFYISLYAFKKDSLTNRTILENRDTVNVTNKLVYAS